MKRFLFIYLHLEILVHFMCLHPHPSLVIDINKDGYNSFICIKYFIYNSIICIQKQGTIYISASRNMDAIHSASRNMGTIKISASRNRAQFIYLHLEIWVQFIVFKRWAQFSYLHQQIIIIHLSVSRNRTQHSSICSRKHVCDSFICIQQDVCQVLAEH